MFEALENRQGEFIVVPHTDPRCEDIAWTLITVGRTRKVCENNLAKHQHKQSCRKSRLALEQYIRDEDNLKDTGKQT